MEPSILGEEERARKRELAQLKDNFSKQIKLGLDLQGGTHLVLQVQVQEAIAQETDQMVDRLTKQLREKGIRYDEIRRVDDTHILVRNVDATQASTFRDFVQQQYGALWDSAPAAGETSGYTLTLRPSAVAQIQENTMTQSLETIERRINALGLTEPTIQRRGRNENEILVQLPGEGDPARAPAGPRWRRATRESNPRIHSGARAAGPSNRRARR